MKEADALVFVYAIDSKDTFYELEDYLAFKKIKINFSYF